MRWLLSPLFTFVSVAAFAADAPNVLVVITDDQGFGELGAHGNPVLKTPELDRFAKESVWLKNFYVSPVCSPTRSSLLTGLYNYRTGVVDTYIGRSMMRPDVPTLAEHLAGAGYRTGLFASADLDFEALLKFLTNLGYDRFHHFGSATAEYKRDHPLNSWGGDDVGSAELLGDWMAEM